MKSMRIADSIFFVGLENGLPPTPEYNTPITAKENFKLLLSGKRPYWIPVSAFVGKSDLLNFRPRENGDNIANHQVMDGGEYYDYVGLGDNIFSCWFDLIWEYVSEIGGATVRPGSPKVSDINKWEEYVKFPDLDKVDWKACGERNKELLAGDKFNQLGIQCGLWERLMSLMDADKAAIALIDEEQKEGVHRLFDKLCDFYDDYIGRVKDVCDIDGVLIHEDWAHQNGPFFSPATAREMLVPYMQRIAESCKKRGLYFEHHCCGKVGPLIEPMLETGAACWCGQQLPLNDTLALAKKYKDRNFAFGVPYPAIEPGTSRQKMKEIAEKFLDEYGDCKLIAYNMAPVPDEFFDIMYELYRERYCDCDD